MYKYMKQHETYFEKRFDNGDNLEDLYNYHNLQICWIQHERLIHLLVTLFTAALVLAFALAAILLENLMFLVLFVGTTILLLFYIIHYYRLENGVQHWYDLSNELHERIIKRV